MKKTILVSSVAVAIGLSFNACSYKTVSGIDQCGKSYTDTIYRTYDSTNPCYPKNVKFSKDRSKNFITPIPVKENECCPTARQKCPTPPQVQKCAPTQPAVPKNTPVLSYDKPLKISVVGQGVAPCNGTCSPAQAYAMAKRAAIADAYRLIAEKVKGVYVEGDDYIKNMMVKRSTVKTFVQATIRNANVVETTFKDGLCEVEMEISLSRSQLPQ